LSSAFGGASSTGNPSPRAISLQERCLSPFLRFAGRRVDAHRVRALHLGEQRVVVAARERRLDLHAPVVTPDDRAERRVLRLRGEVDPERAHPSRARAVGRVLVLDDAGSGDE